MIVYQRKLSDGSEQLLEGIVCEPKWRLTTTWDKGPGNGLTRKRMWLTKETVEVLLKEDGWTNVSEGEASKEASVPEENKAEDTQVDAG